MTVGSNQGYRVKLHGLGEVFIILLVHIQMDFQTAPDSPHIHCQLTVTVGDISAFL